jgi:hypothetical protein
VLHRRGSAQWPVDAAGRCRSASPRLARAVIVLHGQFGATFWHFRHESRVTSPPPWIQNLILPPLWALAKAAGKRPYYDRWDSRTDTGQPD